MTTAAERYSEGDGAPVQASSLGTAAARNLATTTKTPPQMQGISSRWLLKALPWVDVAGGAFRVNRRLTYTLGNGRLDFEQTGAEVRLPPPEFTELPLLAGFAEEEALAELARRCEQRDFAPGDVLAEAGAPADALLMVAHGKLRRTTEGKYGDEAELGLLADGEWAGETALTDPSATWEHTLTAVTSGTLLTLPRAAFTETADRSPQLRAHLAEGSTRTGPARNADGEAEIALASGHAPETVLPGTFVDYELAPREYELSAAQTVLRIHTRVADLYNEPMNQLEEQLRLTVEALRERQEHELVNNREFGLLHNADLKHRIHTRSGPPTPDDLDELLATVWKDPSVVLAHPKAIAAIGREWSSRGIYPDRVEIDGNLLPAWRGIPLLPCGKIPVSDRGTTSILAMRTGQENQGVVGLHRTGIPDEIQPGLNARFMGIDAHAVMSYLVSAYYSAAVLVPDALGVLEDVEIGR